VRRRDAHAHRGRLAVVSDGARFQEFSCDLAVECSRDHRSDQFLGPERTCFPAYHVQVVVAMCGRTAQAFVHLRGRLSLRAEAVRQVFLAVCLVQMAKAMRQLTVRLVSQLLLAVHDPVCLLDRVKLAVPQPWPEALDSRQLLAVDSLLPAQQRQLAEERSWDSQS
jgi:hypothetical protein